MKAKGRRICGTDDEPGLPELQASYSNDFEAKMAFQAGKTPISGKVTFKYGDVTLVRPNAINLSIYAVNSIAYR